MATRGCPFCGKEVYDRLSQCPYCRESLPYVPQIRSSSSSSSDGGAQIRRGLLCVLLATVIGYFAGGYSGWPLPIPILPVVTKYLSPLLFLSGFGLALHGYIQQHRSHRTTRSS